MAANIYRQILEKYSLDELAKPMSSANQMIIPPSNISDAQDYLILESHTHGTYQYSDLLVAKSLSHHGKNWYQCHEALHAEGFEMLTLRQFVDFLNILKLGKAFDGKGNKVSSSELEAILQEITEKRNPWRAEWLDADFKVVKDKLHLNYEHRYVQGKLQPQRSEPLQGCLMEDKTPGIDLSDYLKRATSQGLPPTDVKSGSLYYWSPADGYVARFGAGAGGVVLSCGGSPQYSGAGGVVLSCGGSPQYSGAALGVRRRRAKN